MNECMNEIWKATMATGSIDNKPFFYQVLRFILTISHLCNRMKIDSYNLNFNIFVSNSPVYKCYLLINKYNLSIFFVATVLHQWWVFH